MSSPEDMSEWDMGLMIESALDFGSDMRDAILAAPDAFSVTLAKLVDDNGTEIVVPVFVMIEGSLDEETGFPVTIPMAILVDHQNPAFELRPLGGIMVDKLTGERTVAQNDAFDEMVLSYAGTEKDVRSNGPHGGDCECEWPKSNYADRESDDGDEETS